MRLIHPLLVACILSTGFFAPSFCTKADGKDKTSASEIKKASIGFRISPNLWLREERFDELMRLFEKHKGVTDEVSFFHSTTHTPLKLDEVKRRAKILKKRVAAAKKLGYSAGINILTTIGHHPEALSSSISTRDFTPVTDSSGAISPGSFCPNDPRLREYIHRMYEAIADAEPDFIWIDDDVRLAGHMPIHLTCFCDRCMEIFSKETGKKFTRESLNQAFTSGDVADRIKLRKRWLQHNRDTIDDLFKFIEKTVHAKHPGMELGFMTGDRFYEGYDFDRWAHTLSGPDKAPVRWRPGGGFYTDYSTPGLSGKSHDIGRQVSMLPPEVVKIQSEIENFPYQRFRKSAHITALEAASHIAAGCTGAAFNVLSMYDEPLDEFDFMVARLCRMRPYFDLMASKLGRQPLAGIWPAWNKDSSAACGGGGGSWTAYSGFLQGQAPKVLELGLPAAYSPKHSPVILLGSDNINAFSDDEVRQMLSKGVYMDVTALGILHKRGFHDLTGFDTGPAFLVDCIEEMTDHPLNRPFAGRQRDCRQSFYHNTVTSLKPIDDKAQILSRAIDYEDKQVAPCVMGVYENRLGGRVCVSGYYPWSFLGNLSRSTQMKSITRWLSKDTLPGYVTTYHKVNLWIRQPLDRKIALALNNSAFDPAEGLKLALLTDRDTITVYDMDGKSTSIKSSGNDGPYRTFVLPRIPAWESRLVVTE
ncbi:MAG: hypothetical protein JXM70_23800 [Pirellulales bacterium]|nr:hypothetical protein [Pirellulales bacterium]